MESFEITDIFILFAVVGAGFLYLGYYLYKKSQAQKSWPSTEGKVITSEVIVSMVRSHRTGTTPGYRKRHYKPFVVFEYTVNGKKYTSDKVSLSKYHSGLKLYAEEVIEKYPQKKDVTVYYDPNDLNIGILEPGKLDGITAAFSMGGILVIIGIGGVIHLSTL